jgi:hypothetical protein
MRGDARAKPLAMCRNAAATAPGQPLAGVPLRYRRYFTGARRADLYSTDSNATIFSYGPLQPNQTLSLLQQVSNDLADIHVHRANLVDKSVIDLHAEWQIDLSVRNLASNNARRSTMYHDNAVVETSW